MGRIILAGARSSDFDEYYRIRCSPADIYWNGFTSAPESSSFKELFLSRTVDSRFELPEDRNLYFIRLVENGSSFINVGFIQLIKHENSVEIGYSITEEYQGNGYATEALCKAVELAKPYSDRIIVKIRDDNIASQKVAIKSGFIRTDTYIEKIYPVAGRIRLRTYLYPSFSKDKSSDS